MKQRVFSCVHTSGGVTIFSLYDCRILDIQQINDWTRETSAAWLVCCEVMALSFRIQSIMQYHFICSIKRIQQRNSRYKWHSRRGPRD